MEKAHVRDQSKDETVKDEISIGDEDAVAKLDQTKDESKAISFNEIEEAAGKPVSQPSFGFFGPQSGYVGKIEETITSIFFRVELVKLSGILSGQPKLRYAWWEDFQKIFPQQDRSLTPIVVLAGEPEPNKDSSARQAAELQPGAGVKSGRDPLPERIRIYSEEILKAMQQIDDSPGFETSHRVKKRGLIMLRPYPWLNYFEQPLRDLVARLEQEHTAQIRTSGEQLELPEAVVHLRCLIEFINVHIRPKRDYIVSSDCVEVYFHELWYLYRPGDEVLGYEGRQAFRITDVKPPPHYGFLSWGRLLEATGAGAFNVKYKFRADFSKICFDGRLLRFSKKRFSVTAFHGKKHIKSFSLYPIRLSGEENIRNRLIKRGQMFLDVTMAKPMYYSGFTLAEAGWGETPFTTTPDHVDGPVVIDFEEAVGQNYRWQTDMLDPADSDKDERFAEKSAKGCFCCKDERVHNDAIVCDKYVEDFKNSQMLETVSGKQPSLLVLNRVLKDLSIKGGDYEPGDDEYLVMDSRAFGFILRSRKWAQLSLDHLTYENRAKNETDRNAFDRLVLPDGYKDVVQALVTQHFRDKEASNKSDLQSDMIRGKGKGVIMLLHGAPGVGKTTTAEGIAEVFKKPLFQITCGDLGITASDVEEELERNFSLASKWGCIMLLDEADVFLAQRERKDFVRNGLVSVFLRVLEYYTGVLFLTTNRVGDFDEAFSSRIHMSLFYPELDWEKTKRVFELNLELIEDRCAVKGRKLIFDKSSILNFAENHFKEHDRFGRWNGRQIRNAFQTALALAEFEAMEKQTSLEVEMVNSVFLQLKHLKTVQEAYLDFAKYLGDIYGTEGDRRAPENRLRASEDEATYVPGRIAQRVAGQQQQYHHHHHHHQQQDPGRYVPQGQREDQSWHTGGYMPSQASYHYVSQTSPRAGFGLVAENPGGGGPVADQAVVDAQMREQNQPGRSGWSEAEAAPRAPQRPMGGFEQRGLA
ncbi:hypothetical protein CP532_0395 [Ophiocordyceps camponoti-leonardi (nom. inval.)]|nr:hypothetical protein CP532_0395 [Ophiocordyceps camponoti-leonardi (nom. inval.)]